MRISRGTTNPKATPRIPAHLNWARDIGELLFGCKQIYVKAWIDVEGSELILGAEILVCPPGLMGLRHLRNIGIVNRSGHLLARGQIPDPLVAIIDHYVKVSHGWQKIEIAIGLITPPSVVEGIQRPVAIEELLVLFHYDFSYPLVYFRRQLFAKGFLVGDLSEDPVALVDEMGPIKG